MPYIGEVKCPYCGTKSSDHIFQREWTSQNLIVNEVVCKFCDTKFRVYSGEKKNGDEVVYTIPKLLITELPERRKRRVQNVR